MFDCNNCVLSHEIVKNLSKLRDKHIIDDINIEYNKLNNNIFDYITGDNIIKYVKKGILNSIYYNICKINDEPLNKIENHINYFTCNYYSNINNFSYDKNISLDKLAYIYIIIPINNEKIQLEILHNPIKKNIINIETNTNIFTTYNNLFQIKSCNNFDIFVGYIYFN